MSILDAIRKKREGQALDRDEVFRFVEGTARGTVPDYQAAALLMAIYFRGMDDAETAALTDAMTRSGARLDLSDIDGVKVDKHSTGGVGDKVSLPLAPAVAACGGRVPMISGRALGHTGGTLDKLESIPGFRVGLSLGELKEQVRTLGLAFGAATEDLAPADRKLYQLRDATCTVESIPLITSSILSKKVAEGIDGLVLDVKTGSGAFLSDPDAARRLAETLVATAERLSVRTVALLTDMSQPLGKAVGNAVEVAESIRILRGEGPDDVTRLVVEIGAEMLVLSGLADDLDDGRRRIRASFADGSALDRFRRAIEAQDGDAGVIDDESRLPRAKHRRDVAATSAGFVHAIDTREIGLSANALGAGRETMDDAIDPAVGLYVEKRIGDRVAAGEPLLSAVFNDEVRFAAVEARLRDAFHVGPTPAPAPRLILDRITKSRGAGR